jgi:hypothetical protein
MGFLIVICGEAGRATLPTSGTTGHLPWCRAISSSLRRRKRAALL